MPRAGVIPQRKGTMGRLLETPIYENTKCSAIKVKLTRRGRALPGDPGKEGNYFVAPGPGTV